MNKIILKQICLIIIFSFIEFHRMHASVVMTGEQSSVKPLVTQFVIDPNVKYQVIDNFSASDGWSMQFIGLWPDNKQKQIADWLFSVKNDNQGKPLGIGLSLWRFNIGAGSTEQGDESQIGSEWTRSECFLLPDGTYDWSKQQGQRNFLQLAKNRGVNQFLAFILSPPVYWTQNGLATNTGRGASFNLKENRYTDYARFMADVIQGIERTEGVKFDYICPFNEPDGHWNWVGPKQEGTAATNMEIARTVKLTSDEFVNRGIDTKILVSESFDYNCMYQVHPYTKADRGYQIQSFFNKDSSQTYIGNLPNVPKMIAAHSYWTNTPLDNLRNIRVKMNEVLKKHDVKFWQTEFCIMNNDDEIGGGGGFDKTMKTALYVARIIHHDLVYANASAWQWWRSVATGDYKDGLILCQPDETKKDGTFTDSKLMWSLGNYSRFIRPGATRIGVVAYDGKGKELIEGDTDPSALMISAFQNSDKSMVVVIINYSNSEKTFHLKVNNKNKAEYWRPYCTNDNNQCDLMPLAKIKYGEMVHIPSRSIITLVSGELGL